MDSELAHQQIVRPALVALREPGFKTANDEYLSAFDHYLHGRYKECLADCLKAFESTMKIICEERRWPYKQTDTAGKLLNILFEHELIPPYLLSEFTALRSTLESGVPVVRNLEAGHGQGVHPKQVPRLPCSVSTSSDGERHFAVRRGRQIRPYLVVGFSRRCAIC